MFNLVYLSIILVLLPILSTCLPSICSRVCHLFAFLSVIYFPACLSSLCLPACHLFAFLPVIYLPACLSSIFLPVCHLFSCLPVIYFPACLLSSICLFACYIFSCLPVTYLPAYLFQRHCNGTRFPFSRYLCVLCLFMAAQVNLALEGPAAEVAGEGLVAGVLPSVRDEVAAL